MSDRLGARWLVWIVVGGAMVLATCAPALAFSIKRSGGASGTVDMKVVRVRAYNPATGQPTIGLDPSTGAADNLVVECQFSVLVPNGHAAAQLYYDKTATNDLWVDGHVETKWTENVAANPTSASNQVVRTWKSTYVSPTKFAPGTHTVKCRLNINGAVPESSAHKGNNEGSAAFTVVKVMRAQPKWPGH